MSNVIEIDVKEKLHNLIEGMNEKQAKELLADFKDDLEYRKEMIKRIEDIESGQEELISADVHKNQLEAFIETLQVKK